MKKVIVFTQAYIIACCFLGCKTIDTLHKHKDQESHTVKMNKVLVVGLTTNAVSQSLMEERLVAKFKEKGIDGIKSMDYFSGNGHRFISKQDIENAEEDLIEKGFTTILISKLVRTDERKTILQTILKLMKSYNSFDNDGDYSDLSFNESENAKYITYNTQTAVYCICPDKEKSLIWNTTIELKKHTSVKRDIKRFTNYLFKEIDTDLLLVN